MKVQIEPRPLTQPLRQGQAGATVSVEPLVVGYVTQPAGWFHRPGGPLESVRVMGIGVPRSRWWTVPCTAFLIRHPTAGPFLVDTGLHGSVSAKPSENLGRAFSWWARPELDGGHDLPSQLRERDVDSRDIRMIVMTHLHVDHASGMAEFPGATFVLTEAEWADATAGGRELMRGYHPPQYDYAFDYRTVSFTEGIESYSTFGRTFDLFGDGSVRLAYTPGHSAGHQSVICKLRDRDLVIAGDVVYTLSQLESAPGPARPFDPHTFNRSLQELKLFRRQYPQAVIIPSHDPELWATLRSKYE